MIYAWYSKEGKLPSSCAWHDESLKNGVSKLILSVDQVNMALGDMYRVFGRLPIEAQELFVQKVFELMEQRNNTSFRSFSVFRRFHDLALDYGVHLDNCSVLEIGAGKPWGMGLFWNLAGASKYTSIDKFLPVNLDDLWLSRFQWFLDMNLLKPANFTIDDLIRKGDTGYQLNRERIDLIQGFIETYPFQPESFDFMYSVAVLEHVTGIEAILGKMHDILRKNGIMVHVIDLREHHTNVSIVPDKDTSVEFLKYSGSEWEAMYPPGSEHYINRLRASDFKRLFRDAGFETVDFLPIQSMDLKESVYTEIHPEFKKYSLDDLSIVKIRAVLRKR